jgi:hypothetical protein
VIDILHVAPVLWITVLQPDKRSSDVRWAMLDVMHDDRLFTPSWHEDLDSLIVIAVGALVQGVLDACSMAASVRLHAKVVRNRPGSLKPISELARLV